jgi:two-component system NtrC family sensor kinase
MVSGHHSESGSIGKGRPGNGDPKGASFEPSKPSGPEHPRALFWKTLRRLVLIYFVPVLLLAVFFQWQYWNLIRSSQRAHLETIAEQQATTFDLFLRERLVNLANVLRDPSFAETGLGAELPAILETLQAASPAFVDLGLVSREGLMHHYSGPVQFDEVVDYGREPWFQALLDGDQTSILTEIYRGFRDQPHFTIAVRDETGERVLRAALSPESLSDYLASLEGANEVHAAIVNPEGILQVTRGALGQALDPSVFVVPANPERGFVPASAGSDSPPFAYAWLHETPWALVVTDATNPSNGKFLSGADPTVWVIPVVLFFLGIGILVRTQQVVGSQVATEQQQAELSGQLVQAAKLASVGELAAGIAHEINNPLAIIAEEVGVLQDSLDPSLVQDDDEPIDLPEHLEAIHEAVFRCRDITRKLLTFVRRTEVKVEPHFIRDIIDEVLGVMLTNELALGNVEVIPRYDLAIPEILTDRNQLIQVFVNLIKNAMDAMPHGGVLTVTTKRVYDRALISFRDTGHGMTKEQMEKVFLPFFTTKEPGEGTGLGLSISNTIIQNFGGELFVESAPGRGTEFTVELPLAPSD